MKILSLIMMMCLSPLAHAGIVSAQYNLEVCIDDQYLEQQSWSGWSHSNTYEYSDLEDRDFEMMWINKYAGDALVMARGNSNTETFYNFKTTWELYLTTRASLQASQRADGFTYHREAMFKNCQIEIDTYEAAMLKLPSLDMKNKHRTKIKSFGGSLGL